MDFFGGPAALGGIFMCVALAGWSLGRWQGGVVPGQGSGAGAVQDQRQPSEPMARGGGDPVAAIPCQQAAQADRRGALDGAVSLGELHAEVTAYRRDQRVLAGFDREQLAFSPPPAGDQQQCRYVGVTGQPTCALPDVARTACACGDDSSDPVLRPSVQPSPAFGLTRV